MYISQWHTKTLTYTLHRSNRKNSHTGILSINAKAENINNKWSFYRWSWVSRCLFFPHSTCHWMEPLWMDMWHGLFVGQMTCFNQSNNVKQQQQQQQQQPFYGPLSGTTRVSRHQKKHSPTHHPDQHPIFISFFHLPRSIASSLFKLHAWQSFCTTYLHVLFGLPLGLEPSTSYSCRI